MHPPANHHAEKTPKGQNTARNLFFEVILKLIKAYILAPLGPLLDP